MRPRFAPLLAVAALSGAWVGTFAGPRDAPPRVIVLGFDGLDGGRVSEWIGAGLLPNLAALAAPDRGGALRLMMPTTPPESPVSWASMATGMNPGRTGIFGFVRRDPSRYLLQNGLVEVRPGRFLTKSIPLSPVRVTNRRREAAFWEIAASRGIPTVAITVPVSFPPPREKNLRELPGLGVGDLLGTQGTFQYFTTRASEIPEGGESLFGGRIHRMEPSAEHEFHIELEGPALPTRSEAPGDALPPCTLAMLLRVIDEGAARLEIEQRGKPVVTVDLTEGRWSPLVPLEFRIGGFKRASGLVRILLVRAAVGAAGPDAAFYVSPIQIDPLDPMVPLTAPAAWSVELAGSQGAFKTVGLPSELWGRGDEYIGDAAYLADFEDVEDAWERLVLSQLARGDWRLLVAVDQLSDHVGHLFSDRDPDVALRFYQRVDRFVGRVAREHVDRGTLLLVVSDHGMAPFGKAFNVNRWLEREGYLALTPGRDRVEPRIGDFYRGHLHLSGIDWSRTRAYAVGLGSVFFNLRGREEHGIVAPGEERDRLARALSERLASLRDPEDGVGVVEKVYDGAAIYSGGAAGEGPDLVLGLARGYRVSWTTALGGIPGDVLEKNAMPWAADHCSVDPHLVKGVLLSNRPLSSLEPSVLDIAPTVLRALGIEAPGSMEGRSLLGP